MVVEEEVMIYIGFELAGFELADDFGLEGKIDSDYKGRSRMVPCFRNFRKPVLAIGVESKVQKLHSHFYSYWHCHSALASA